MKYYAAFINRAIREVLYVTNTKNQIHINSLLSTQSTHVRLTIGDLESLFNELPNPHTRMESYQLLNSACDEEIRWGARRVPGKQMLISSGNTRPTQRAEKRVGETVSLKANRCVRCTLGVNWGKHGWEVGFSGRTRAVQ